MQNKIYKIIVLLAFVGLSNSLYADKKNDEIKISLPNKTAIEIQGVNIRKYKVDTAFIAENIKRFFMYCKTANIEEMMSQGPKAFSIKVAEGRMSKYTKEPLENAFYELSIEDREIPNKIISSENFATNLYYLQKHLLKFENRDYSFVIKFDELNQLKDFGNDEFMGAIERLMMDNYMEQSKFIEKRHYVVNEKYDYKKIYQNEKYATDQIELSMGTGMQNIKNNWVASIETSMALSFGRKGINKNSYLISYEWQYDFSTPDKRNINQFLSLGYRYDFSNDPNKSDAYTVELGYLVNKQGDFYNDNTFRLGISKSIGKHFSVGPQIYFNDFFKDVIPTVQIGIGL